MFQVFIFSLITWWTYLLSLFLCILDSTGINKDSHTDVSPQSRYHYICILSGGIAGSYGSICLLSCHMLWNISLFLSSFSPLFFPQDYVLFDVFNSINFIVQIIRYLLLFLWIFLSSFSRTIYWKAVIFLWLFLWIFLGWKKSSAVKVQ